MWSQTVFLSLVDQYSAGVAFAETPTPTPHTLPSGPESYHSGWTDWPVGSQCLGYKRTQSCPAFPRIGDGDLNSAPHALTHQVIQQAPFGHNFYTLAFYSYHSYLKRRLLFLINTYMLWEFIQPINFWGTTRSGVV